MSIFSLEDKLPVLYAVIFQAPRGVGHKAGVQRYLLSKWIKFPWVPQGHICCKSRCDSKEYDFRIPCSSHSAVPLPSLLRRLIFIFWLILTFLYFHVIPFLYPSWYKSVHTFKCIYLSTSLQLGSKFLMNRLDIWCLIFLYVIHLFKNRWMIELWERRMLIDDKSAN